MTTDNRELLAHLRERLARWQSVLRLRDWDIELRFVRQHDLPTDAVGGVTWGLNARMATVSLLDPVDADPEAPESIRDSEATLVHELVHVVLARVSSTETDRISYEQGIDALARALLGLERGDAGGGGE